MSSLGNKGQLLIKHYESLHDGDLSIIGLQPKMCPAEIWTEGWGHAMLYNGKLLKGIENKELAYKLARISDPAIDDNAEAQTLFIEDIEKVEITVKKWLRVNLEQHQYDALLSHAFNCGISETLFRLINTKQLNGTEIKDWWLNRYTTCNGVVLPGLILRRQCEYQLFLTGLLKFN